ncbi:MAG TPA: hypothetical protein VEY51_02145, partial [Chondromyces sp.]|nr:hypothetical protein [Chondromyces sp.]
MATIFSRKNIVALLMLFAILLPLVTTNVYYLHILTLGFIWTIAVYGLNLIGGYTGQLSLAHAGFFAIGAYSAGLLMIRAELNFWLALIISCIIT